MAAWLQLLLLQWLPILYSLLICLIIVVFQLNIYFTPICRRQQFVVFRVTSKV